MTDPIWWLYLVRTAAGSLYTGISTDPQRRLQEHAGSARGARALRGRGPLELVFEARTADRGTALRLEARVKRLSRHDKERLVAGDLEMTELVATTLADTSAVDERGGCGCDQP